MIRAIHFLLHRDCTSIDGRHKGFHRHAAGVLYYSPKSWESTGISEAPSDDSEEEDEAPAIVEDLDAMMWDASL